MEKDDEKRMLDSPVNNLFNTYEVVVLADGDMPKAELPLLLLFKAKYVVCCDGAAMHYPTPSAIVGDGDSLTDEMKAQYKDIFVHVSEQEDNDLTKATRYCVSKGFKHILYLGATGKREDHTIGNISLMVRYMEEMGISPIMATDYGWFEPARGDHSFESFAKQQVSIFNFGCSVISADGLAYPCYAYSNWWQGTLNEAIGNIFTIHADGSYLIYRTYKAKL